MKPMINLMVLALFILYGCRQTTKETISEIDRVKMTRVVYEKMIFPIRSNGLVVPAKEIKLSFKTGGIIAELYVDNGATVKKGELLASLDLSEIDAQVSQIKNGYEKALRDYNRANNLYADSVVTLEQLQNAETAMNVAKANLEIATFNRNHAAIYAPDEGVILKRLVESNEMIAAGYPVFLFGTKGKYWKIKAGLADKDYVRTKAGDSAKVTFDVYPGIDFYATVSRVGESANPYTGTFEVELDIQPASYRLASGFVAGIEIFPARVDTFYRIPVEALVEAEGQSGYVYAVTDSSTAKKIKVQIAGIFGSSVAISDGLGSIDEIVTDGAAYLTDGAPVIIVK